MRAVYGRFSRCTNTMTSVSRCFKRVSGTLSALPHFPPSPARPQSLGVCPWSFYQR